MKIKRRTLNPWVRWWPFGWVYNNDLFLNFIFGLIITKIVDSCELKLKLFCKPNLFPVVISLCNSLTFSGFLSWSFDFTIIQDALLNKMTRNLADIQVKDLGVKEQLRWVYPCLGFLGRNQCLLYKYHLNVLLFIQSLHFWLAEIPRIIHHS